MRYVHISDDRGQKTLCGRDIYPETVLGWANSRPGDETCTDCGEIESERHER